MSLAKKKLSRKQRKAFARVSAQKQNHLTLISKKKVDDSPKSKAKLWFIVLEDELKGPYETQKVSQMLKQKELTSGQYAWNSSFSEWRTLASVEEFRKQMSLDELSALVDPYPSVKVPARADLSLAVQKRIERKTKLFSRTLDLHLASFEKRRLGRWQWLSIWAFAIFLSLFTFYFLTGKIMQMWEQKWAIHSMSKSYELDTGVTPAELESYLLNPLYSALQLQQKNIIPIKAKVFLPFKRDAYGQTFLGDYKVISKWDIQNERISKLVSLSPVYRQFYVANVELNFVSSSEAIEFRVPWLGEP